MKKSIVLSFMLILMAGCSADEISSADQPVKTPVKISSMRQIDSISAEQNYNFTKKYIISAEQNKLLAKK